MLELDRNFFQETDERLRILENNLKIRNLKCKIDLMGVGHAGRPEEIVLDKLKKANVVTLELTRRVVEAGLTSHNSKILKKNVFWKTIIKELRNGMEEKKISGIEVNQTPRVAWKRLSLHYGVSTLSPSPITIEIDNDSIPRLSALLGEQEIDNLQKFNWLITTHKSIAYAAVAALFKKIEKNKNATNFFPISLNPGIRLVSCNLGKISKDLKKETYNNLVENYEITFMTPPHPSLIKSHKLCRDIIKETNLVDHSYVDFIALAVMCVYLLSPVSVTETREIAYITNQYVRSIDKTKKSHVNVLHIGGSIHTSRLLEAFRTSVSVDNPIIEINQDYDLKSKNSYSKGFVSFFKDHIPFINTLMASKVNGYEMEVFPEMIKKDLENLITNNRDEFKERLEKIKRKGK